MELEEAIKNRRSIRKFKRDDIPSDTAERLIEIANLAPSAGNLQPRDFIIVKDQKTRDKLAAAALNQDFISQAPVAVVVTANLDRTAHYGERGRTLYCLQDCAAAIQNLLLAAHSMDLGTVWVGAFDEERAARILNLPEHARPVAIIPIGYPNEDPKARGRIAVEELIHYEKW